MGEEEVGKVQKVGVNNTAESTASPPPYYAVKINETLTQASSVTLFTQNGSILVCLP